MFGTFKTDKDINREAVARKLNSKLIGTGINVVEGGSNGPYTLVIKRLNRKELGLLLRLVKAAKNLP